MSTTDSTKVASSGSTARVAAQAKLNLLLRITGRAPNGYHELYTLFQVVALADTVTVRTGVPGRSLDCDVAAAGPTEENLGWRAAVSFLEATGWDTGFAITIEKRIPIGGGMGGGSADAAAVLRALNALAPTPLGIEALLALGNRLGADVPFLLLGHATAIGTGTGATLMPLLPLPERAIVLDRPGFAVSSKDAFGWFASDRGDRPYSRIPEPLPYPPTWEAIGAQAVNDLELPVMARHPELEPRRVALEADGASIARMTGSGSTLFGVFDDEARARQATHGARILTRTVSEVAPVERLD